MYAKMFRLKTIQFHSASALSKMLKTLNKRSRITWYDVKYDTSKSRNVGKNLWQQTKTIYPS